MTLKNSDVTPEERARLSELFDSLDVDKDGRIDVDDLTEALHQLEVPVIPGQAQKFIEQSDANKDGGLDFLEFVHYVLEHEKQLKLSFGLLDHNKDGVLDTDEIMKAFQKLGVQIERAEAEKILRRMDKDGTLRISWEEYRSYLLLHPSSDIWDIVHYWRHASIIDVGEDALVPDDFTENELRTGMWWRHLVAGAAAGAVSRTCTAPLDRLKVFLQVHGSRNNNLGIISGFKHMLAEGGCRSFWRGNGVNVVKIAPESALKFMAYEQIKKLIRGETKRELGVSERFLAGSLAGAISQTAIYPMEVLKTRLALRKTGQYSGVKDCAIKVYQHEGVKSFYKGYVPNLLGIIPYAGIDLCVYETLKRFYLNRYTKESDPGVLVLLACGTISSTCGQLASYPLALIRTKLQAQVAAGPAISDGAALVGSSQSTMVTLFRHIIETEGPRGLYRGITPNFMKVIPAVSISYVVYEKARRFLGVEMT